MSVTSMFEGWAKVQTRLTHGVARLGPEALALTASDETWPVWAIVGHVAGARVYWLCTVFKEPGLETTPFTDPAVDGWEDHLDVPRRAEELVAALDSSWRIVQSCLDRWTPEGLSATFDRATPSGMQHHTRSSVLTRLVMHDSFHCGEVSMILSRNGLESMDPWEPIPVDPA